VKFSVNTSRLSGGFTKRATVYTNDAKHEKETLMCTGQVRAPFKLEPARLTFGQITPDSAEQSKTVRILRGDGGPIAPELMPINNENVKAELREVKAGEEYELKVDLLPPWPARALTANLTLKTGISEAPEDTINVYARVMPRLSADRSQFRIPSDVTSDTDLKTRINWAGGKAGKALGATVNDSKLSVRLEATNNQQYVVLHIPAGYEAAPGQPTHVTVSTDDPQSPTLNIPVYPAPPAPRVRATPSRFTVPPSPAAEMDLRSQLVWSNGTPSKVLEVTSSDPKLTVRLEEQNDEQTVVLHVPAGYTPQATLRPMVTVKTDDQRAPMVRIPVYAPRPAARLRAVPSRFTIPSKPEEEQEILANLKWSNDKPGKILDVSTTDPKLSASIKEQENQQYVVLHVPAGYEPPTTPVPTVNIKTDDPTTPMLSIRVYPSRMSHVSRLPVVPGRLRSEDSKASPGEKTAPQNEAPTPTP